MAGTKRAAITFTSNEEVTFSSGNASAAIRVTNLAVPTQLSDAANKQYVDSAIFGLAFKTPVRAVSMTNATDWATTYANGCVVDGMTLATGDRILVMGQTDAIQNGIYVVNATGVAPTRGSDLDVGFGASGTYVFVDQGTVYQDRAFVCITDKGADIVGTHPLAFVQFSSRSSAAAGHGLVTGVAEELDVNVDNSTLTILSDVVQIKDLGVTNAKLADATIANAKLVHPDVTVSTGRGLLGGQLINLGTSATLTPDFTVVPDLAASNTFTGASNQFTQSMQVGGTLGVTGASTLTGNTTVGGTLGVTGATTLDSTLGVTSATTLSSTLGVTGATTLSNTLDVSGNSTLGGTLGVTGATTLSNTLGVTGSATLGSTLGVTGATTLSNTLDVTGSTTVGGTLGVTGATTLDGTLGVTGATTLSSTLDVTGVVTAPRLTGLADPTAATDAVNLGFVTLAINNATQGGAVRAVAAAANQPLATLAVGTVVDDVTLALGDRVLLAAQSNAVENGVYVVATTAPPARASNLPDGGHAAALTRLLFKVRPQGFIRRGGGGQIFPKTKKNFRC